MNPRSTYAVVQLYTRQRRNQKIFEGGQEAKPTYGHGGRRRYCDVCTSAVRLRRPLVCYTIAKTIQSLCAMSAAWGEATSKIIMVQPLKTIKKINNTW